MNARPWKVLVVAADRVLLRHLCKFLGVLGYEVAAAAGAERALEALAADRPDFLLVDSRLPPSGGRDFCRAVRSHSAGSYLYILFLVESPAADELLEAVEAGADDFLTTPLVHGEVMARLRAGARTIEFERRLREQAAVDPQTGLLTRSAFGQKVRDELARPDRRTGTTVVCLGVDAFAAARRRFGQQAGEQVLAAVAARLRDLANIVRSGHSSRHLSSTDPQVAGHGDSVHGAGASWSGPWRADCIPLAHFGEGEFAALVSGRSEAEAAVWAEQLRVGLASAEFAVGETRLVLSASCGVAAWLPGHGSRTNNSPERSGDSAPLEAAAAERLLDQAMEALRAARHSGGDCVARLAELSEEVRAWNHLAAPGKLFEGTLAQHVMAPCTVMLHPEDALERAAQCFRQSQWGVLPVVDADGTLVGVMCEWQLAIGAGTPDGRTVGDAMTSELTCYDEDTSFQTLMELFVREEQPYVVVVAGGKPAGIVTREALAAFSEKINTATFADAGPASRNGYLLVPDTAVK